MRNDINITIPPRITSSFDGYKYLTSLYHQVNELKRSNITFDFSSNNWFEANLLAVFGAICDIASENENRIYIIPISYRAKSIFERNGFLLKFGHQKTVDKYGTTISYREFTPAHGNDFSHYIKQELLAKPDFPSISQLLSKRMNQSIFEIFENARTHGKCDLIYTCGQYYPRKQLPHIDTTIVDLGISIKKNVNDFLVQRGKAPFGLGHRAIQWAIQKGNTTKTGNISGGLGLDLVLEFLKLNNGKIQIVSSDGYWEYRKGQVLQGPFSIDFPGTVVNIEVNIDDSSHYQLTEEVSFDDIF